MDFFKCLPRGFVRWPAPRAGHHVNPRQPEKKITAMRFALNHCTLIEMQEAPLTVLQDGGDFYLHFTDVKYGRFAGVFSTRAVRDHDMEGAIAARREFEVWAVANKLNITWES